MKWECPTYSNTITSANIYSFSDMENKLGEII